MTIPGAGGQVPPRPDQQGAGQPAGVVVSPGSGQVIRARQVIITGTNDGMWIYNAGGQLIVSAVPAAGNDPVDGSPELAGVTAYIYEAGQQLAASLSTAIASSPAVSFQNMGSPGTLPPAVYGNSQSGTGTFDQAVLSSGQSSGGASASAITVRDSSIGGAITLQSAGNAVAMPGAAVTAQSFTSAGDMSVQGPILFVGNGSTAEISLNPQMPAPTNYPLNHISTTPTSAEFNAVVDFCNSFALALMNIQMMA